MRQGESHEANRTTDPAHARGRPRRRTGAPMTARCDEMNGHMLEMIAVRVRAEYREMPGLSLTASQAARLLGLQLSTCERVLRGLVLDGVLFHTSRGVYVATPSTRDHRAR